MRYNLMLMFFISFFPLTSNAKDPKMTSNNYFKISTSCGESSECTYNNESDISVDITIRNINSKGFYIPLTFIKKIGPAVELVDLNSNESMPLKPNLVSWDLKNEMTFIPENESVSFKWTILDAEIKPFIIDGMVNVSANFSVFTKVYDFQKNDVGELISSSKILIKGKNLDEDKH